MRDRHSRPKIAGVVGSAHRLQCDQMATFRQVISRGRLLSRRDYVFVLASADTVILL